MNLSKSNEAAEQEALFRWAAYEIHAMPELSMLFHIPNEGKRSVATGAAMKRQGLKAGVPDLCLPVPRGGYHGLWIELKAGANKVTPAQRGWLDALQKQGYCCAVCYGWTEAAKDITEYLKKK